MARAVPQKKAVTTLKAPSFRALRWHDDGVTLLDQTRLPTEEVWLELSSYRDIVAAIREMRIRGAPAIGVAGA